MAEEKKSFLIYTNLLETLEYQSNEVAGELFKHMLLYVNDRNPVSDNPLINALFIPIKQKMKFDLDKWEGKKEGYSKAGKMSSLSKSHKDLHSKVKDKEITLDEALKIAETRKETETTSKPILKTSKAVKPVKDNSVRLEQFEKVWDIYNLKKGKKRSLALWLKLKESDIDKIRNTIVDYVNDTKDSNFRKHLSTYLSGECWNDEIKNQATKTPGINQGFKNSFNSVEKVVDLFNDTPLTITIKKYTTSKEKIKVRLDEFLEKESLKPKFKNRQTEEVLGHFINSLEYNVPVKVVDLEAKRIEDKNWANRYNT